MAVHGVERDDAVRDLEFAELFTSHDRILAASGSLDRGDVFLALNCLLVERPDVRRQIAEFLRVDGRLIDVCGAFPCHAAGWAGP